MIQCMFSLPQSECKTESDSTKNDHVNPSVDGHVINPSGTDNRVDKVPSTTDPAALSNSASTHSGENSLHSVGDSTGSLQKPQDFTSSKASPHPSSLLPTPTQATPSQVPPPTVMQATPYTQSPMATGEEFKQLNPQSKRLHVSNIPFRFREQELRQLFYVSPWFE